MLIITLILQIYKKITAVSLEPLEKQLLPHHPFAEFGDSLHDDA